MSVTLVFRRFHEDAFNCWLNDRESFVEQNHLDCESIQLGVECMAVADLVARATNVQTCAPYKETLFEVIVGTFGVSVGDDGDYPRIINAEEVVSVSRMLSEISHEDLRGVCDIDRLKRDYLEMEDWWEHFGPTVLEDRLIPMFETIRDFFHTAAERKQKIVVSWF
jgi:hypothetical protein